MKKIFLAFAFLNCNLLFSQVEHQAEVEISARINESYAERSYNLGYQLLGKGWRVGINSGIETWYVSHDTQQETLYQRHSYPKLQFTIGCFQKFKNSPLSIGFQYGLRLYLTNNAKDILSLSYEWSKVEFKKNLRLSGINREYIGLLDPNAMYTTINGITFGQLSDFYYVTEMRFAHLAVVDINYRYQQFNFKVFYMPYLIRFKYQNARYPEKVGANYLLFSDIGIGVGYVLNDKKE